MRPLSPAEVREVDRRAIAEYGMANIVLMENAGRGCADVLSQLGCKGSVAIVCGKGNNAGDGFVIARHLDLRGVPVRVLLVGASGDLRGDAAANYAIVSKAGIPIGHFSGRFDGAAFEAALAGREWIVDALLGTGTTGSPRPPLNEAIRLMNAAAAKRLAVDLPSGLDCDTGEPAEPTVRADVTCTFVAEKIGFSNSRAKSFLGEVKVLDIGAPRRLLEEVAAQ
jgi:NAD(P)H-hydrate epimerase